MTDPSTYKAVVGLLEVTERLLREMWSGKIKHNLTGSEVVWMMDRLSAAKRDLNR